MDQPSLAQPNKQPAETNHSFFLQNPEPNPENQQPTFSKIKRNPIKKLEIQCQQYRKTINDYKIKVKQYKIKLLVMKDKHTLNKNLINQLISINGGDN